MQGQILIIILLAYHVTSLDKCKDGYILRHRWINGTDKKEICCQKVVKNCSPGSYVEECKSDLGQDLCQLCPGSTWLADETNSTNIHKCVPYSCTAGAKRVDYLPKSGCHQPCICDIDMDFYGFDSCNCKLFEGICPPNTTLTFNGNCLPLRDADRINNLRPDENVVYIPIIETSESVGFKNNTTTVSDGSWTTSRYIITVVVAFVVIVLLILLIVSLKYACKHKSTKKGQLNDNTTDSDLGTSSTTMSTDTELENIIVDQQMFLPSHYKQPEPGNLPNRVKEQEPLLNCTEQAFISQSDQLLCSSEHRHVHLPENPSTEEDCKDLVLQTEQKTLEPPDQTFILTPQIQKSIELPPSAVDKEKNSIFYQQNRKQIAIVLPSTSKTAVIVESTDHLPVNQNVVQTSSVPSPSDIVFQRPPHIENNHFNISEDENQQVYSDFNHDFGSPLLFTRSETNLA